jgi:hypothetical protein
VLQVIVRVLKWALPFVTTALIGAVGAGYAWINTRAGRVEMADAVAKVQASATAAQAASSHCASVLDGEHGLIDQSKAAWGEVIALHAELQIYREYGHATAQQRAELIDDAVNWYAKQYKDELGRTAIDAQSAAARTLKQHFRPDHK